MHFIYVFLSSRLEAMIKYLCQDRCNDCLLIKVGLVVHTNAVVKTKHIGTETKATKKGNQFSLY